MHMQYAKRTVRARGRGEMSELYRLGKVKLETDLMDLGYRVIDAKAGEKSYKVAVVEFELKRPIATGPEAKEAVKLIKAFAKEFLPENYDVLAISGRGPIWFYGMLTHELVHITRALAIFDPKLNGAVIVAVHYGVELEPGDVIEFERKEVKELTQ